MKTTTKNRIGKLLMSLGVAYLTSASSLQAQCYDNSFGWDLSETGDLSPIYVCSTELDINGAGGDYDEYGTMYNNGGAIEFTVDNLPPGTYDIAVSGDGYASHGQYLMLGSGSSTNVSDLYHGGTTTTDFVVTEGEPLHVRIEAAYAIAYVSSISFYGPKSPPEPPCYYDSSFGWDLTETGDLSPVYLCDDTEIDINDVGGDYYDENGTLVGTSGALEFTVDNLPPGTYDISIAGDGPYSHGEHLTLTSGSNTTTSDLYHDGTTITDFVVTEGEPLHVRVEGVYAFAYVSGISFYGPKSP